jgi:hypothetical protein
MVQRFLDRPGAVAALAAVVGCLIPLSKVDAQGTTDVAARKKVEQFLGAGLPGKATVHFVDLNGDGVPEALVIRDGDPQDCGTHGCAANVLDLRGPAAKDIGDFIAFDFQPLSSRTRGWRDLSLTGSQNSTLLRFNGRVYSSSSTPAADPSNPAGVVSAAAPVSATTPSATGWEFTYFSGPDPRLVGSSLGSEPKVEILCQPSPRSAELRIDPGKNDPNTREGKKSHFLIEIQNASGHVQKFPLVANNFGPDGGSQFYSRDFLSAPFLDAFGQEGGVLRWRTDKGGEIASWLLTGTAAAREIVRKVCNL